MDNVKTTSSPKIGSGTFIGQNRWENLEKIVDFTFNLYLNANLPSNVLEDKEAFIQVDEDTGELFGYLENWGHSQNPNPGYVTLLQYVTKDSNDIDNYRYWEEAIEQKKGEGKYHGLREVIAIG